MIEKIIGPMEAGKKVHRYVRLLLPGVPLSGIHKMIRTGRIKRNGKKAKPDDVLLTGDVVRLYMAESDFLEVKKSTKKFHGVPDEIDIIAETPDFILVNKPIGLLTHGAPGEHKDTLVNRVLAHLYRKDELDASEFTPSPVNRLDRNTSGLVLFGKTGDMTRRFAADISAHAVRKWYLAIVRGTTDESGEITADLSRDNNRNLTIVTGEGQSALTRYERLASYRGTSVVKIELVSGRTHQIRAHFKHIGHPLWDDVKYGGARQEVSGSHGHHQWLHAAWLQFRDGTVYHAPLSALFVQALRELGYSQQQIAALDTF